MSEIKILKIEDIPEDYNPTRAGALVYTIVNNELYFCFGKDFESGDYTDFGGGVKRTDTNPVQAGLRELIEESLGVFGIITEKDVSKFIGLLEENMLLMLIHINLDIDHVNKLFKNRLKEALEKDAAEISDLVWMSYKKLKTLIDSDNKAFYEKFYHKTFLFLKNVDIYHQIITNNS